MPQLTRDNKQLDLKAARKAKEAKAAAQEEEATGKKPRAATPTKKAAPKPSHKLLDDTEYDDPDDVEEEDDGDDDDIIAASVKSRREGGDKNIKFAIIGGIVVVVIIVAFLIFRPKNNAPVTPPPDSTQSTQEQQPAQSGNTGEEMPPEIPDDPFVGTQDFRGDTNMTSDSELSDPDDFIKDIYGLTLRVDYKVSKIQSASDFVNYEKKRGTWGGGLELYYLDAEYKGNHYVIQVPFQYYKELDDTGIVPVKMEVLRIQSETDGTYLSVISYMCLDEKTLESVLKTQTKK